jgi:CRISPR-associated protein Cas1
MLASAGVLVGFYGEGGTTLLMANEIEWMTPQSEYRPTEYMQEWMSFWFDEQKRLEVAKQFQIARIEFAKFVLPFTLLSSLCFASNDKLSSNVRFLILHHL